MRAPARTITTARRLRKNMTRPERDLWALLRRQALAGFRFRRQHPMGPFVLDFYCPAHRLCVEVDGPVHLEPEQRTRDRERDRYLRENGIRVLRFSADDIMMASRQTGILNAILSSSSPASAGEGDHPKDGGGGASNAQDSNTPPPPADAGPPPPSATGEEQKERP